jgi:hypothetical protein
LVERERGKEREKIHTPFHLCTRAPEWNSLWWLVKSERGKGKEESYPFGERKTRTS